jgi:aminoglycoside phosphotransferase
VGPERVSPARKQHSVTAALDRDPAVPQRDLLLDPSFVVKRLGLLLGPDGPVDIDDCRQVRVKYRVGARLRVVHRIRVGAASFDVAGSTFPTLERSEQAYAQTRTRAVACGSVRPVAHDRRLTTVFWTFPNDRKIANLPALSEPAPELAELVPAWARSVLTSYAPEKAATVICLDATGRTIAYAKAYAGEGGERAGRVHDALTAALTPDDPHVRLPRSLAYSAAHRTLLVEPLEGVRLQSPESPNLCVGYRRLGRALARLHLLAPPDSARFRRADPDRLEAAADLIGSVRGDVAATALSLTREISPRLDADGDLVCLHGDVNFRNALLQNGRVALIDLDQVASGPAGADLGSVLASLRYAGVVGLLRRSVVPRLCAAFLAGYSELRPLPGDDALRAHTAAALLVERSLRVVTRVRPDGLRRLPALLAEAGEALR